MLGSLESCLIEAVYGQRLAPACLEFLQENARESSESDLALLNGVLATCENIGRDCAAEKQRLLTKLDRGPERNVGTADSGGGPDYRSFHRIEIAILPSQLDELVSFLQSDGYLVDVPVQGAGWELYKRLNPSMELIKTDGATTRLVVRWAKSRGRSRVSRLLLPSSVDCQRLPLPKHLWPVYFAYRPIRITIDLLRRQPKVPNLGPFLGTPQSLIKPLLEFAGVTKDDLLVDLGCGDGRVVIEAAGQMECNTLGVEINENLISIAQKNVREHKLEHLVRIEAGDASSQIVRDASVVFVFLPVSTVRTLLPELKQQLRPGAKIITHEQVRPDFGEDCLPDESRLVFSNDALTVAHLWTIK